MSESYTHLLIATSKNCRPTPQSVCQFLERLIQAGAIGGDHSVEFVPVIKGTRQSREVRNPFTGKVIRIQSPSRKRPGKEKVPSTAHAVPMVEQEREYDIAVVSTLPPANPSLDVGCVDENGTWRAWTEPYHLRICCRVRGSLVRLCLFKPGENPNAPLFDSMDDMASLTPQFDEDCGEDEQDGLFVHPEVPNGIRIPNAGCGQFWVEFEYGKWLYPRLKGGSCALLKPAVIGLATEIFGTHFVEACSWG